MLVSRRLSDISIADDDKASSEEGELLIVAAIPKVVAVERTDSFLFHREK